MSSDTVLLKREGSTVILILNRPDKHNALNAEMIDSLHTALQTISSDQSVRSVILRAHGKSFCAGADLSWMQDSMHYSEEENYQDALKLASCLSALNQLNKPVIACVQGSVYGGGVGIVACCDIVISAPESRFCLSEVKLGLIPAVISPFVLEAIGANQARRYFLTAEMFSSIEAKRLGLVHEVAENPEIMANDMAKRLLGNAPRALSESKRLIFNVKNKNIDDSLLSTTAKKIADIRVGAEAKAGLEAFFAKEKFPWQVND